MTRNEEQELLELTRQNNELLRAILHFVQHDEANDFMTNIIANVIGNKIDPYEKKRSNAVQRPF